MKIVKTKFKDLLILDGENHKDKRGYFREIFLQKNFRTKFPFDVMSFSKKNVLRGLHLQMKNSQAKFITVMRGKIFDVALDCRPNSKTFGKYFSIKLSENINRSLLIPKGFAHGFYTLTNNVIVHYKCSNYRNKNSETGILWNDKDLKIKWPCLKPIVSNKDHNNLSFSDFKTTFFNH